MARTLEQPSRDLGRAAIAGADERAADGDHQQEWSKPPPRKKVPTVPMT